MFQAALLSASASAAAGSCSVEELSPGAFRSSSASDRYLETKADSSLLSPAASSGEGFSGGAIFHNPGSGFTTSHLARGTAVAMSNGERIGERNMRSGSLAFQLSS